MVIFYHSGHWTSQLSGTSAGFVPGETCPGIAGRAKSKRHSCVGRQIAKQRPIDKAELAVSEAPSHAGKCRKQPDALPDKTWTFHVQLGRRIRPRGPEASRSGLGATSSRHHSETSVAIVDPGREKWPGDSGEALLRLVCSRCLDVTGHWP